MRTRTDPVVQRVAARIWDDDTQRLAASGPYRVWAYLPDSSIRGAGWSLVALDVSREEAEVYRSTFRHPVHIESAPLDSVGT